MEEEERGRFFTAKRQSFTQSLKELKKFKQSVRICESVAKKSNIDRMKIPCYLCRIEAACVQNSFYVIMCFIKIVDIVQGNGRLGDGETRRWGD